MKGLALTLIFFLSMEEVFSCLCILYGGFLPEDDCPKETRRLGDRIYQLDTKGDQAGCYGDRYGNKWCKFFADPDGCYRDGKGNQWCYNKVPPSRSL